jgi:hypothetical protein
VSDTGLADNDAMAIKEEARFKMQFEKKAKEPGAVVHVEKTPQAPTASSGFTVEQMERMMKESEEKKRQIQLDIQREKDLVERLEREKLDEARRWEEDLMKKKKEYESAAASGAFDGKEKSFLTLQVEAYLAKKSKELPKWVEEELATAKTKKFGQRLLDQINMARTQPRQYAERLLELVPFFSENSMGGASFVCEQLHADDRLKDGLAGIKELIKFLENRQPCGEVTLEKGLSLSCMELCEIQGKKGIGGS